uniref:Uncharacterized protein n=2 Tax=Arundo donax TaxID=35708 RepID=A0A0A9GKH9_ARUDO
MKPAEVAIRSFYIRPSSDQATTYQCTAILKASDSSEVANSLLRLQNLIMEHRLVHRMTRRRMASLKTSKPIGAHSGILLRISLLENCAGPNARAFSTYVARFSTYA